MAQLINNITDLQKHLTISGNFDFNKITPYTKRAERKFIISQISFAQYTTLVAHVYVEGSDLPINRVKLLLCEASANYALLLALPLINLQITNYGIKQTATTQSTNADWKDIKDLKRYLLETANEAVDDAIEIMEDNASDFAGWTVSDLYTVFKNNIVRHTKEFQEGFDIQKNRATFLSVQSYMTEVEEQYFRPMLGKETLALIKTVSINEDIVRVQKLSRLAMVALTVAKVATTGKFSFTGESFVIKTSELPWEKSKLELTPENQEKLRCDRQNAGQEFLKMIKTIVKENPVTFPDYTDDVESGLSRRIINRKSHLSL